MSDKPRQINAHLALLAVGLIYGANYVIAKSVMPDPIPPNAFILMRVLGAVSLFWLIRFFLPEKVEKKDFLRLILCGMTGVAINQLLFFQGLNLTSPINASVIMTSNPIIVMVFASIVLHNPISKRKFIGVVLGAVGSIALILLSASDDSQISSPLGDLFILINAISYAVYLVAVKPLMSKYKPLTVITWVFTFGLIMVTPFGIGPVQDIVWSGFDTWQIFSLIYVIVFTTFLAYLMNVYALSIVQPTVSSAYIYLQPLFATLAGFVLAGIIGINYSADFGWKKMLCTALVFAGIYLVSFGKKKA